MVCGKGGAGKSAISVLMSRLLAEKYIVYLVDSDESNELLPRMLGAELPRPLVEYLGGKQNIFKIGEVDLAKALETAGEGIRLGSLPEGFVSKSPEGISLVTIGKVRKLGEGCACPFNFLTRVFLKNLRLSRSEMLIVDTDAGVEHVGRGVEEGCDGVLAVIDPTAESIALAGILKETAKRSGKRFWAVVNKATPEVTGVIERISTGRDLKIDGFIRFDEDIFESCLEGGRLRAGRSVNDIKAILERIGLL